jgi:hypothetical protein
MVGFFQPFRDHRLTLLTMVPLALAVGCLRFQPTPRIAGDATAPSAPTTSPADSRDDLIGWYAVTGKDRLIPVFKRHGTYYSVCRGFETPLKPSPAGLEWAFEPSSMKGTTIGRDPNTGGYYLAVVDAQAANFTDGNYGYGEKEPMTRIDPPAWLVDLTAAPPHTLDDFPGWYQAVLFPGFPCWELRKNDAGGYEAAYDWPNVVGGPQSKQVEAMAPLPDRLGFTGFERSSNIALVYNEELRRYEIAMAEIRMPLARIAPPRTDEEAQATGPIRVGIPSWH